MDCHLLDPGKKQDVKLFLRLNLNGKRKLWAAKLEMSPQLHPTAEAPSDISYSPVTQYPSPYASHAYSGKSMVRRNSPAFTPGGPAWIMSVEQTLPSQVAKSKLPLGNGLCLALPCPGRPQDGLGEGSWPWPSATPGPFLQSQSKDRLIPAVGNTAWHCLIY